MKTLVIKKTNCEHVLGTFLDESHYDTVIDFDCDVYGETVDGRKDESNILFKFRKNVFSLEEQKGAYRGLVGAAGASQNRGLAAGPKGSKLQGRDWVSDMQFDILEKLSQNEQASLMEDSGSPIWVQIREEYASKKEEATRGFVWLRSEIEKDEGDYRDFFEKWLVRIAKMDREAQKVEAKRVMESYISDTTYANPVFSGIAGYYGRYPRIPYKRPTSYTEHNPELFKESFDFLKSLDGEFKKLLPERYKNQKEKSKLIDPKFLVSDTVFTTITVNKNFRTAAHRDAGDYTEGFSNLSVLTDGSKEYAGAYLVVPEYRAAINIRPGDLLLINNHECIHGNTPLIGDADMERISIVCYFREDMLEPGSWEYEALRRQFVTERSKNKEHKNWRPLWNGVSAGMWESEEWAAYLEKHNIKDEAGTTKSTLEDFFL